MRDCRPAYLRTPVALFVPAAGTEPLDTAAAAGVAAGGAE